MALITTPGAIDANSYATVEEGNAYHDGHLYASAWFAATSGTRETALIMARRGLDDMPRAWTGAASTEAQVLSWPRTGMSTRNGYAIPSGENPADLKNAQAEFARQLIIEDRTGDNATVLQGISSLTAGPVSLSFEGSKSDKSSAANFLALRRRNSLEAVVPDAVLALLPPSWLKDPREEDVRFNGLVIEVL